MIPAKRRAQIERQAKRAHERDRKTPYVICPKGFMFWPKLEQLYFISQLRRRGRILVFTRQGNGDQQEG